MKREDQLNDPGDIRYLGPRKSETWRERFPGFAYLISPGDSSTKTAKSNKLFAKYFNAIQYLAPATMATGPGGINLCPSHTPGCYGVNGENCIAGSGRYDHWEKEGSLGAKFRATLIARTRFFLGDPYNYLERLLAEIDHLNRHAKERGKKLALRLNGTSDIPWEKMTGHLHGPDPGGRDIQFSELFGRYPDVIFYDYTKVVSRVVKDDKPVAIPSNYYLTFSESERNAEQVARVIRYTSVNVAVVQPQKTKIEGRRDAEDLDEEYLREKYGRQSIVDGDLHDLRFRDPPNSIVGLRAKGGLKRAAPGSPGAAFQHAKALPVLPNNVSEPIAVSSSHPLLSADQVRDSKLDPDRLREWLDAVAATVIKGYETFAGPWSVQIGADTWSFATPAHTVLAIRADLNYPPMAAKVSRVVMATWIETLVSSERTIIGAGQVSDLARFMGGGGVKMKIGKAASVPVLPVIIGGRVFSSPLIASAIRGAPREEKIRVAMTPSVVDDSRTALFIQGNGWLAMVFPTGYDAGDSVPSGYPGEGRPFHEVVPILGEMGTSGQLELRRPLGGATINLRCDAGCEGVRAYPEAEVQGHGSIPCPRCGAEMVAAIEESA